MSFKLMLSLEEYKNLNPVYPLEVPSYLSNEVGISLEDYYLRAMTTTQRLINSYMQNALSNIDWDINKFDLDLRDQIKWILFKELEYLHQNQMFFQKSNSISYSTSGQQSFTFNPDSDNINESLIPQYIKIAINNTGLLKKGFSVGVEEFDYQQRNNEFKDKVLVPNVAWSDKADNLVSIGGNNNSLYYFVNYIYNDYFSKNSPEYSKVFELAKLFALNESTIIAKNKLSSNIYFENKLDNDYAQIADIIKTFYVSNNAISSALTQIGNLSDNVNELKRTKVDLSEFNDTYNSKADTNLANVNLGSQNIPKFIQVATNGEIILTDTSGSLNPIPWTSTYEFIKGDFTSIVVQPKISSDYAKVRIFCAIENNVNKSPIQYPKLWAEYEINYEDLNSLTKNEANKLYLKKLNPILESDLDANNFNILNSNNLLIKSDIDNNVIADNKLWTSNKIVEYVNQQANNDDDQQGNTNPYLNSDGNIQIDNISNIINLNPTPTFEAIKIKNIVNSNIDCIYDANGIDSSKNNSSFKIQANDSKLEWLKVNYSNDGANNFNPLNLEILVKYYNPNTKLLDTFNLAQDLYKLINLKDDNLLINNKIDSLENLYNILVEKLRTFRPFEAAGVYDPHKAYNENQWVFNDGDIYVSKIDANVDPLTDPQSWYHWDLQIDISNFVTVENLANVKNELSKLITINKIDINNLTEKIDNLQNLKQDKLIAGEYIEISANNEIKVNLPTSIKPIAFRKGEIKFFDTQENVDEIIKTYKLLINTDFVYVETDRYIMTMNINKDNQNAVKGGNNFISQTQLPDLRYDMKLNGNGWNDWVVTYNPNKLILWTRNESGNRYEGQKYEQYAKPSYAFALNGGVQQIEYKPKYYGVIGIRFLKNIEEI